MNNVKGIMALAAVALLSSCVTTTKTARTASTSATIKNATVADLRVADKRITYTMSPSKAIQRAGLNNVKQAAIQEALTLNGNADVLVEPEFVIEQERSLFGSRINSITVTGRPAYYENFRTLPDSVWHKPGFYGQPEVVYVGTHDGKLLPNYGTPKRGGIAGLLSKRSSKNTNKIEIDDTGWRRRGLKMHVNIMGGYARTHYSYTKIDETENSDGSGYLGALGTIGIQTGRHWFFGVGSGFYNDWEHASQLLPIYGNVRYYLSPQKNSLFLDYKMGGSVQVGSWNGKGGVFISPSIGYSFGSFELGFQFVYQEIKPKDVRKSEVKVYSPHFGLVMGFKI